MHSKHGDVKDDVKDDEMDAARFREALGAALRSAERDEDTGTVLTLTACFAGLEFQDLRRAGRWDDPAEVLGRELSLADLGRLLAVCRRDLAAASDQPAVVRLIIIRTHLEAARIAAAVKVAEAEGLADPEELERLTAAQRAAVWLSEAAADG